MFAATHLHSTARSSEFAGPYALSAAGGATRDVGPRDLPVEALEFTGVYSVAAPQSRITTASLGEVPRRLGTRPMSFAEQFIRRKRER